MPNKYLLTGAMDQADLIKAGYADAEIHLFKLGSITITPATTLAELEALECDFTGYAAIVIAAWLGPMLGDQGGAVIWSGSNLFASAAPYSVQNTVMGWWLQTAGGVAILAGTFDDTISMGSAGQALPWEIYLPFGVNPTS